MIAAAVELRPFAVTWELRGLPRVGFSSGVRRVYATDEKNAAAEGPRLVALENAWPEGNVVVTEVRPLE